MLILRVASPPASSFTWLPRPPYSRAHICACIIHLSQFSLMFYFYCYNNPSRPRTCPASDSLPLTSSTTETDSTLKNSVKDCLKVSSVGDCSRVKKGAIGEWDVSQVTDMSDMFSFAQSFNRDISEWNVARVTDMRGTFYAAQSFNSDISDWEVSKVTDMSRMFYYARSFSQTLCGNAWINLDSKTTKQNEIFDGSSGSISTTVCGLF